jgi:hypothetical protein
VGKELPAEFERRSFFEKFGISDVAIENQQYKNLLRELDSTDRNNIGQTVAVHILRRMQKESKHRKPTISCAAMVGPENSNGRYV